MVFPLAQGGVAHSGDHDKAVSISILSVALLSLRQRWLNEPATQPANTGFNNAPAC